MNTEKFCQRARVILMGGSGVIVIPLGMLITLLVIVPGVLGLYGLRGLHSLYCHKSRSNKSK